MRLQTCPPTGACTSHSVTNTHTHTEKILQNLFSLHPTMSSLLSPDTWTCPRSQLSHQLLLNNKEWQFYFRLDFALWVCLGGILIRISLLFQSLHLTSEGQNFAWHAEKLALYSKTESEGARRMLKYPSAAISAVNPECSRAHTSVIMGNPRMKKETQQTRVKTGLCFLRYLGNSSDTEVTMVSMVANWDGDEMGEILKRTREEMCLTMADV